MLSIASAYHNNQTENAPSLSRPWRVLQIFNVYRVCLGLIIVFVHSWGIGVVSVTITQPQQFIAIAVIYCLFGLTTIISCHFRLLRFQLQASLIGIVDILLIAILTYLSLGVGSGLGILLTITIAGMGLLLPTYNVFFFAALATVALLFQELLIAFESPLVNSHFLQVGVLGVSYFATAILVSVLLSRLRASEAMLNQRSIDLASMERLNQCIIERLHSGIVVVDKQLNVCLMNEAAGHLLGVAAKSNLGTLHDLSSHLATQLKLWLMQQSMPSSMNAKLLESEIIVNFTVMHDGQRDVILLFLEDASRIAQRAQQMKLASLGRFTASIAHELRNPLGAIAHASQLLAEAPELTKGDARLVQIIGDHVERMNVVIKSILQLSRRKQSMAHEIDLTPWLEKFIDDFKSCQADCAGIELTNASSSDHPMVCIDPDQLYQVLTNLCENGLQHGATDNKENLRLWVDRHPTTAAPILEVYDQGEGISPETLTKIFEPFFTTSRSGTGLGLYIAKELCEANQARLEYVPGINKKGRFRITFYEVKDYVKIKCINR